jgi:serine protease Do
MTQETLFSSTTSSLLPDAFSHALMQLVQRVQPSIVHVIKEGRGAGTGIVWNADGSIITNHHVVPDDTTKVEVHLPDGRKLDAKLIARNPKLDLAMLHIPTGNPGDLQAVPIGDSAKLRVGEWVFAVGNPWGQRGVVTAGIVSSVSSTKAPEGDRSDSEQAIRYVKSDVILAPGNSGGPLLDADGRVVGVNAMVFGGDLAVSIPSNVVISWIESLPRRRNITLGIELEAVDLPVAIREKAGVETRRDSGLLVVAVDSDQLNDHSDNASLLIGDLLLDAASKPIDDAATLLDILGRKDPQETLPVRLVRGGNVLTLDIAVAALERKA